MRIWILTLTLLLALAGPALGQPCLIGVYADEAGIWTNFYPSAAVPFDVYVIMRVESTVAGVAFTISWPQELFASAVSYGPNGLGLNVNGAGGMNVGLGECAIGYNSQIVTVVHYSVFPVSVAPGVVSLGPNTDEHPSYPVYASCADELIPCEGTLSLYIENLVSTESASIGSVKALYRD